MSEKWTFRIPLEAIENQRPGAFLEAVQREVAELRSDFHEEFADTIAWWNSLPWYRRAWINTRNLWWRWWYGALDFLCPWRRENPL